MATRRSRRAASRRGSTGAVTSTNAAGLRQSTRGTTAASVTRMGRAYRPGGNRSALQFTASSRGVARTSGS